MLDETIPLKQEKESDVVVPEYPERKEGDFIDNKIWRVYMMNLSGLDSHYEYPWVFT